MLSLRAIFECQHFCPTPAVPLRYFLNTPFVRCSAMMRPGLYLVKPDGSVGYCDFYTNSCSPDSVWLIVYNVSHSRKCFLCEIFCFKMQDRLGAPCINRSMDSSMVGRHISCFCLFHTWVAFIFSFHYLSLTGTHTLTHTQSHICT